MNFFFPPPILPPPAFSFLLFLFILLCCPLFLFLLLLRCVLCFRLLLSHLPTNGHSSNGQTNVPREKRKKEIPIPTHNTHSIPYSYTTPISHTHALRSSLTPLSPAMSHTDSDASGTKQEEPLVSDDTQHRARGMASIRTRTIAFTHFTICIFPSLLLLLLLLVVV